MILFNKAGTIRGRGHLFAAFMILVILAGPKQAAWGVDVTARTGTAFCWWDDNRHDKGEQFYIPVDIRARGPGYSLRVLSGYHYTYYDGKDTEPHSMADLLDTKLNLTAVRGLPWSMKILMGLDLNLPTGRTRLAQEDLQLLMDPDLVSITSLGEGFNVNPLVLLARSWGKTDTALGYSYVWRGKYDFTSTLTDYDPGEIQRFVAQVRFRQLHPWDLRLGAVYTDYGTDKLDGKDLYEPGSMWRLTAGMNHSGTSWSITADINYYKRGRDRLRIPGSFTLQNEEHNGYGDEVLLRAGARYRITGETALGLGAGYLWIGGNDYPVDSEYYMGGRRKLSIWLRADQALSSTWSLGCRLSGFTMHDEEAPSHPGEDRSFRGYGLELSLKATF